MFKLQRLHFSSELQLSETMERAMHFMQFQGSYFGERFIAKGTRRNTPSYIKANLTFHRRWENN